MMPTYFLISYETADPSAIRLGSLYWKCEDDGRWSHSVNEIAGHFSVASHEVSKRVLNDTPAYLLSHRCTQCGLPFKVKNRTEFSILEKGGINVCRTCREIEIKTVAAQCDAVNQREREQLEVIWRAETSYDPRTTYEDLEFSEIIEAFSIFTASHPDEDGNLRFLSSPALAPTQDVLIKTLGRMHDLEVLLIGRGTPLDTFVLGELGEAYAYYPAKVIWRFATLKSFAFSETAGRELAHLIDNPPSDYELWNGVAGVWWETAYAESFRYLNEQLGKYRLKASDGDALKQSIYHGLSHFSVPQLRNILWKLAKDVGAYSAEVGVIKPRAANAIPCRLTRMVDRYVSNSWEVKPYVLRWDTDECVLFTTLFDRALKIGETGFKTLTGNEINAKRQESLDRLNEPVGRT